jgi:hypothetical protein
MKQIERAARALCSLELMNPDTLIYDMGDLEICQKSQALGIAINYHRVKPNAKPKRIWELYVPWAETVAAALRLEEDG